MRYLLVCLMFLILASCSQTTDAPPTGEPQIYCEKPKPTEPIDGGIGGTGAQPEQHCDPSKF